MLGRSLCAVGAAGARRLRRFCARTCVLVASAGCCCGVGGTSVSATPLAGSSSIAPHEPWNGRSSSRALIAAAASESRPRYRILEGELALAEGVEAADASASLSGACIAEDTERPRCLRLLRQLSRRASPSCCRARLSSPGDVALGTDLAVLRLLRRVALALLEVALGACRRAVEPQVAHLAQLAHLSFAASRWRCSSSSRLRCAESRLRCSAALT